MLTLSFLSYGDRILGIFEATGENQQEIPSFAGDRSFCEYRETGLENQKSLSGGLIYNIILYPPSFSLAKRFLI